MGTTKNVILLRWHVCSSLLDIDTVVLIKNIMLLWAGRLL